MADRPSLTDLAFVTTRRPVTRRAALRLMTLGGVALGLAACTPTPPRNDAKPAAPAAPAATAAPAAAAAPTAAPAAKPTTAAGAPAAAAKPTEAPKPAAAAPAPTAAAAPATIKKGGTLVIAADVNPVGLDPHAVTAFSSVAIYEHLYSSLATLDYKTNAVNPHVQLT